MKRRRTKTRSKRNAHGRVNRYKAKFGGDPNLEGGWLNGDVRPVRKKRNVAKKVDKCWHKRRRVPKTQTDRLSRSMGDGNKIDRWSFEISEDVRQEPLRAGDRERAAELVGQIKAASDALEPEAWHETKKQSAKELAALKRANRRSQGIASLLRCTGRI